jgi:hypothetical protein
MAFCDAIFNDPQRHSIVAGSNPENPATRRYRDSPSKISPKMSSKRYHFITHWIVDASMQEVYRILEDAEALKRWWPSVYLDVRQTHPGDEVGLGKTVELYTKGYLPYTLRWRFVTTEVIYPTGFSLEAEGDFKGKGEWIFTPGEAPGTCHITYDWSIEATKPLLRRLSWLLRPLFSFNHHWAMRKGLQSLKIEIERRKAEREGRQVSLPQPPRPTWPHRGRVLEMD